MKQTSTSQLHVHGIRQGHFLILCASPIISLQMLNSLSVFYTDMFYFQFSTLLQSVSLILSCRLTKLEARIEQFSTLS